MTAISLLAIKIDSPPGQLHLDPETLILRLDAGVHLNLADTSEDTCRTMARLLMQAARVKAARRYVDDIRAVA